AVPRDAPPHNHIIGKPMQNMHVRLYDRYQNLVPIGVPGELYIGGASVSRGYLHQPELTAEKLVPNPFAVSTQQSALSSQHAVDTGDWRLATGDRLYKTGDLARY